MRINISNADYEDPIRLEVTSVITQALRIPGAVDQLKDFFDLLFHLSDSLLANMMSRQPPLKPIACREGCEFCCDFFEVHVTPLEALRIAAHINEFSSKEEKDATLRRIVRSDEKKKRLSSKEALPRIPCPLLREGGCSVYGARPFTCRGMTSFDAITCQQQGAVEGYLHSYKITRTIIDGLCAALAETGRDPSLLDLTPAIRKALDDPDAGRRWQKGNPAFKSARARFAEAPFSCPGSF